VIEVPDNHLPRSSAAQHLGVEPRARERSSLIATCLRAGSNAGLGTTIV
jgi:hypothetical protein